MMLASRLRTHLRAFAADESGASVIEYALIAAATCIAIAALIFQIGDKLEADFQEVHDSFDK